jgi:hypothetical protein
MDWNEKLCLNKIDFKEGNLGCKDDIILDTCHRRFLSGALFCFQNGKIIISFQG